MLLGETGICKVLNNLLHKVNICVKNLHNVKNGVKYVNIPELLVKVEFMLEFL